MYIKKMVSKWRYLGYDKNTIDKYYRELNKDNMLILGYTGIVLGTAALIGLILLFSLRMDRRKIYTCLLFLICTSYVVIRYKFCRKNENKLSNKRINFIIDVYSFIACIFAIYLGVFLSRCSQAVTIIWLFLFLIVIFNRLPMQNMKFIPMMIIFVLVSLKVKVFHLQCMIWFILL